VDFSPRLIPKRDEIGEAQFKKVHKDFNWDRDEYDRREEDIGPDHLDYDEHVDKLDKAIKHYNRIIILLQGLFDRSRVFHPHAGVKLTRDDHIGEWVVPVRDEEDGLPSNVVTWEAYRDQMNTTIRRGNRVWSQWCPHSRDRYRTVVEQEVASRPAVCEVTSIRRDRSAVRISWSTERRVWGRYDRWGNWVNTHKAKMSRHLWVPMEHVFNTAGYTRGDYKMFLCDRTLRGEYLKWAPAVLHAEDEARKRP
jgi:hypothetical protein